MIKGELNKEELDALVLKYPKSSAAIFENENGEKCVVYLKKVDRENFVLGNKLLNTKDEVTVCEFLLKNLWIAGVSADEILKDFEALKNCTATIMPLLYVKAGELKKN